MPVWSVSEPFTSLWLHDEPWGYQPARGEKLAFRLNYKQRDTLNTNKTFNVGNSWECNLLSFIQTMDAGSTAPVTLFELGGGEKSYDLVSSSPKTYATSLWQSKIVRFETNNSVGYFWHALGDGSTNYYRYTNGVLLDAQYTRWYLTEQVGATGNTNRFVYETTNGTVRLKYLVDADGLTNTISYTGSNPAQITQIQDPFGRIAYLYYDGNGFLTNCVDVAGLSSFFRYDNQGTLTNLNTPYGPTYFKIRTNLWDHGTNYLIRAIEITQPDGGTQMYAYIDYTRVLTNTFPSSVFPSNALSRVAGTNVDYTRMGERNSFYWDPRQYAQVSDGSKSNLYNLTSTELKVAHQKHWLQLGLAAQVSQVLSMERLPSPDGATDGQTIWYAYDGTSNEVAVSASLLPSLVAKILPDGTTNMVWYRRNQWGNPTNIISTYSVAGSVFERTNALIYSADGVDLLENWITNGTTGIRLVGNSYNSNHQVLRSTNAVGEITIYTYDSTSHLMTSRKTPAGLTTTNLFQSTPPYRLVSTIDIEIGRANSFAYNNDLVQYHTNELTNVTTFAYDALRRMTNTSDGRGTITYSYSNLDLVSVVDRLGNTTTFSYDPVRRKVREAGPTYTNGYAWCQCGFAFLFYECPAAIHRLYL